MLYTLERRDCISINTRGTPQVLHAMPSGGVAFFNCGEHSGRSQPHKHLQVVPLPFADDAAPAAPPIARVVDDATTSAAPLAAVALCALPFRAYAARLPVGCVRPACRSKLFTACRRLCSKAWVVRAGWPHKQIASIVR